MVEGSPALWFGASGFEILDVVDDGVELVVSVQTTATFVGCPSCGTRARPKDRRWVTLRDAPSGDRAVRLRWRKRIWSCTDLDCEARTWTEQAALAEPRRVLTARAGEWACDRVAAFEGTPSSIARGFGVSWATVWAAVERVGRARVDDGERVGPVAIWWASTRRSCSRRIAGVGDASSPPWSTWAAASCSTSSRAEMPANYGHGWPIWRPRGWPKSRSCRSTPTAPGTRCAAFRRVLRQPLLGPGTGSVPPSVVAVVMVLQRLEGLSDREAVERYAYDARWRYTAGVGGRR